MTDLLGSLSIPDKNGFKIDNKHYGTRIIEDVEVILYNNKIVVPAKQQRRVVAWYHEYTQDKLLWKGH
jgi:hypothetical protein